MSGRGKRPGTIIFADAVPTLPRALIDWYSILVAATPGIGMRSKGSIRDPA